MRLGPSRNVQSVGRDERLADGDQRGRVGAGRAPGLPQGHERKEAHDADEDDGGFEDPGGDEAERHAFVLPLDHREQRDGGADAGEGDDDLEEAPQRTAVSAPEPTM